jgi:hypothetical protein
MTAIWQCKSKRESATNRIHVASQNCNQASQRKMTNFHPADEQFSGYIRPASDKYADDTATTVMTTMSPAAHLVYCKQLTSVKCNICYYTNHQKFTEMPVKIFYKFIINVSATWIGVMIVSNQFARLSDAWTQLAEKLAAVN